VTYPFQKITTPRNVLLRLLILCGLIGSSGFSALSTAAQESSPVPQQPEDVVSTLYLPGVQRPAPPPVPQPAGTRRVNIPYFQDQIRFSQSAIFWFGAVSLNDNYTDVRVGYTQSEVVFRVAVFDRLLWYDQTPSRADLLNWDSASLQIELTGSGQALTSSAYRFDAQINGSEPRPAYQASYRGNGSAWAETNTNFTTTDGSRWESSTVGGLNNNQNNRGWTIEFSIPFSSLGLASPPSPGTIWRLGVVVYDREDAGGSVSQKSWPEQLNSSQPDTWGELRFGLPAYTPPALPTAGSLTIRNGLNGATVRDAAAGGTIGNLCPWDPAYIWNGWGSDTFGGSVNFNIQNQADLADWPCFSKYYISFPLQNIPSGKVITSARLTLHLFGNSDPNEAQSSLIQVFSLAEDFNDANLSWNNAPLALENVAQTWVDPSGPPWPYVPYTWDVTLAVAQAYSSGAPARLAMYSADGAIHSGKYFVSSEFGDWPEGRTYRPTLVVTWGNP
jgi:hypothetical protein